MQRLTVTCQQRGEAATLHAAIVANLRELEYGG